MGKYIRHGIAALVGAILASLLKLAGVVPDDPQQITDVAERIALLLEPLVMLLGYAWSEKALKRFPWLDREGAADRAMLKEAVRYEDAA